MYKKAFVSFLCIVIVVVSLISVTGCTTFQQPTGVWYCKKLELTIDFDRQLSRCVYDGVLQKDERNQRVLCNLNYITGRMAIYRAEDVILEAFDQDPVLAEPLYQGGLQSRGTKKRKFYMKNPRKEYVFVKVE